MNFREFKNWRKNVRCRIDQLMNNVSHYELSSIHNDNISSFIYLLLYYVVYINNKISVSVRKIKDIRKNCLIIDE